MNEIGLLFEHLDTLFTLVEEGKYDEVKKLIEDDLDVPYGKHGSNIGIDKRVHGIERKP